MSKIGAKIQREKRGQRYYSKRPKARVLEDCPTEKTPSVEVTLDTDKSREIFKSTVKEVYLGREVGDPPTRVIEPLAHTYARRIGSALLLATLVLLFVSGIFDCESLPHAF